MRKCEVSMTMAPMAGQGGSPARRGVAIAFAMPILFALFCLFILPAVAQESPTPDSDGWPKDATPLDTEADIVPALREMTIYGRYANDGENWIEYHLGDGRTAYWEKGCTYPGRWWVEKGFVCYAYPSYNNDAPNCFRLFRRADGGLAFYGEIGASLILSSESLKIVKGNDAALPVGGLSACVGT